MSLHKILEQKCFEKIAGIPTVVCREFFQIIYEGGDLSLNNGFGFGMVSRIVMPPSLPLPPLKIVRLGDTVVLTRPASASGAVLEMTDAIPPTAWMTVSADAVQIGDQMAVTVDIDSKTKFFRLRKP